MKTNLLLSRNHKIYRLATIFFLLALCVGKMWGADETITFSEKGYSNAEEVTSVEGTDFTISFDKGSNSNAPKYYTSGTAIRIYVGGCFTVSSTTKTIENIKLTFGSSDGSNEITTDVGTYSDSTWTGSATSIKFTIGGTSGNRRLSAVAVTYASSYTVNWSISPAGSGELSATSGTSITVTPNAAYTYDSPAYSITSGNATVSQNGNTFTATPAEDCSIQINMKAKPKYTVTLNAGSGTCGTPSLTETTAGGGVTLPTVSPSSACLSEDWEFAGWKETSAQTETTTLPTLYAAGANYKPQSNCTLYAVYKKTESGSGFGGYELVTSAPSDWTADKYVLVATTDDNSKYILTGQAYVDGSAKDYGAYTTFSNNTEYADYELTIGTTATENCYSVKIGNKYLSLTKNDNNLMFADEYTAQTTGDNKKQNCDWKLYYNSSTGYVVESPFTYSVKSGSSTSNKWRIIAYNSNSGQERFACYPQSQKYGYLYKRIGSSSTTTYNSNPSCSGCAVPVVPNNRSVMWYQKTRFQFFS